MGLPCAHTLKLLVERDQPLLLHDFHPHWHLERLGTPDLIIEPRRQVDRITIHSKLPSISTRRAPCTFEAVEKTTQPRAQPTCSRCRTKGHKMISKQFPLRYESLLPSPTTTEIALPTAATTFQPSTACTTIQTTTHTVTRSVTRSLSPTVSIIAEHTTIHTTAHTTITQSVSPTPTSPTTIAANPATTPAFRYDHPCAIFQRYQASREAWYTTLPRGSIKTNQQYRKTIGLPTRYSEAVRIKSSYKYRR